MGLSTAERNKRKRERKKKARDELKKKEEEQLKQQQTEATKNDTDRNDSESKEEQPVVDVEIEYVAEDLALPAPDASSSISELTEQLQKFQARALAGAAAASLAEDNAQQLSFEDKSGLHHDSDDNEEELLLLSKRKLREKLRPTVAELKRRVARPDLVEAHDVTAADPDFLIELKAAPGTVPVPRHWGRKRKYLQGKRGFEKPPFQLPDFIVQTGITEIRDTVAEAEAEMSAKQKNRARVAPKMGAIDVDYRTLHDAFFKFQTKPKNMKKFGDLYYEGKEMEVDVHKKSGGVLSKKLREALGMTSENEPPPWLLNMQRYGPPPSYPGLKIPGLNAPLPGEECQYGFHPGGWGKPPVDQYGRPLYGGNPFDPPGSKNSNDNTAQTFVTSDGKMIEKAAWGELPAGVVEEEEEEEEEAESSEEEEDDMEDSDEEEQAEEGETKEEAPGGARSVLPPPPTANLVNLRKQDDGGETPTAPQQPKALYQVLEQTKAGQQAGAVFTSEVAYAVPQAPDTGAESVLSKAVPAEQAGKRKRQEDDEEDELGKSFKF